ncbi:MAG TPA: signal peptide peptidase SppA [Syntrophales bacterium]|nr:signal peptide peptidase SppA [Syntrophales bacterium]
MGFGLYLLFYAFGGTGKGRVFSQPNKVGVVTVEGIVTDASDVVRQIEEMGEDGAVKAVVVRINSPGGGVAPAEEIFGALKELRKKKKVVASMGSIAASGAYLIACASDRIVANPGSVTGSLSAIMHFANAEALLKKIGLQATVVKSGRFKDIGTPVREMTPEERELLQGVVDDIYDHLLDIVSAERKIKKEELRKIADGRIFTGRQAKSLGLVDELGDQGAAVRLAGKLGGIEGKPEVVYPRGKKRRLREILMQTALSALWEQWRGQEGAFSGPFYLYLPPSGGG